MSTTDLLWVAGGVVAAALILWIAFKQKPYEPKDDSTDADGGHW